MIETYAEVVDKFDLRTRREKRGMTYRDLAAAIGSPNSWSSLRRLELPASRGGRHTLSVQRAVQIAAALGIEPEEVHHYFRFHGVTEPTVVACA